MRRDEDIGIKIFGVVSVVLLLAIMLIIGSIKEEVKGEVIEMNADIAYITLHIRKEGGEIEVFQNTSRRAAFLMGIEPGSYYVFEARGCRIPFLGMTRWIVSYTPYP